MTHAIPTTAGGIKIRHHKGEITLTVLQGPGRRHAAAASKAGVAITRDEAVKLRDLIDRAIEQTAPANSADWATS